jgi:hypothetical protein
MVALKNPDEDTFPAPVSAVTQEERGDIER